MPKADNLWEKAKDIILEWGRLSKAKPGLMHAIVLGLDQWRGEDKLHLTAALDNDIKEALQHQSKLGWDCAPKGILTKKWAEIQH
eukprot:12774694-Ditylum_brightwellii.AAC.1